MYMKMAHFLFVQNVLTRWDPAEQVEVEEGIVAIDANGNKLADGDFVYLD